MFFWMKKLEDVFLFLFKCFFWLREKDISGFVGFFPYFKGIVFEAIHLSCWIVSFLFGVCRDFQLVSHY